MGGVFIYLVDPRIIVGVFVANSLRCGVFCVAYHKNEIMKIKIKDSYLRQMVHGFTERMQTRLAEKEAAGWSGYYETANIDTIFIRAIKNLVSGDFVDAANLAMFLWSLEGRNKK